MSAPEGVTEILIARLKEGVNLETNTKNLIEAVESQNGFIRQYWGHVVEDPTIFVRCCDWESFEDGAKFSTSELGGAFGLEQPLTIYTRWTTDAAAAFEAPVTEVAIYTLPAEGYDEESRQKLEKSIDVPSMKHIKTVGRSPGGAIGWVFWTENAVVPEGHTFALVGAFGYPSVEDHVRWKASPECAQAMKEMSKVEYLASVDLRDASVPGGNIFAHNQSMFHVRFHQCS